MRTAFALLVFSALLVAGASAQPAAAAQTYSVVMEVHIPDLDQPLVVTIYRDGSRERMEMMGASHSV